MSVCDEEELLRLGISREEKDKLVAEVIRHVLFKAYQSSGCPIKREDLTQLITKNYRQYTLPSLILNEAKEKLLSIFGYEMKELQRSRASSTKQARSSQQDAKSYVITSRLPSDIYCKFVEDKGTCHASGFAFVVLGIIHLGGGQISEENLWQHLKRVGLNESDENHPVFGNIKQALEALVQQRYLQKDKINGPEGNTMMYGLAERALDEAVSKKLKDYIAQIAKKDLEAVEGD